MNPTCQLSAHSILVATRTVAIGGFLVLAIALCWLLCLPSLAHAAGGKTRMFDYGAGRIVKVVGLQGGHVSFSKKTHTLTLRNAKISGSVRFVSIENKKGKFKKGTLVIILKGKSTMSVRGAQGDGFGGYVAGSRSEVRADEEYPIYDALSSVTVTGPGSLSAKVVRKKGSTYFMGLFGHCGTLRFKGGSVTARGTRLDTLIDARRVRMNGGMLTLRKGGMRLERGLRVSKGALIIKAAPRTLSRPTRITPRKARA